MNAKLFYAVFVVAIMSSCQGSKSDIGPVHSNDMSAIDSLNRLIIDNPNGKDLYLSRALVNYQEELDEESAFKDLDLVQKLDSSDARPHYYRALWNLDDRKIEKANSELEIAIGKDPDYIDAYLLQSRIYFFVQNYEQSILSADQALKRDLYNAEAYFLKGLSFKEAGDTTKAVSSFLTATEQDQNFYDAWMELGLLYGLVNHENTEFYYDNALRINPESTEALYNQALFYQNVNRIGDAKSNYQRLMELDSTDVRAYYNMGYVHLVKEENYDSAAYFFRQSLAIMPKNADAAYNLGLSYELNDKTDSAVVYYKQALSIIPNHDLAARALQRILG